MVPRNDSREPETVEQPFTVWSAEGLLIGVPIGIVMLIVGGALRVDIAFFRRFLFVCVVAGIASSIAMSRRTWLQRFTATQRTVLEMVILLGFASFVCASLLRIFLVGRAD